MKTWFLIIPIILLLAGCSSAPAPTLTQEIPTESERNIQTAVAEESTKVALEISAKETVAAMGTQTQAAMITDTPEATPTPVFQKWTIEQAMAVVTSNNLEFADPQNMSKDDYGMAPMNASGAVHFGIPSLCPDCGGRLYTFDDPEKLQIMKAYYDTLSESSAMFFSWTFAKDNVLIQVNGDLPEDKARQYEAALNQLQ